MRNMLALAAAFFVAFLGVGYFQGWYKISTAPGPDGQRSVTIDLNTKKIGADVHSGTKQIQSLIEKATQEKTTNPADPKVPANTASSAVDGTTGPWFPVQQQENPWARPLTAQPTGKNREELSEPLSSPWRPVGPPAPPTPFPGRERPGVFPPARDR